MDESLGPSIELGEVVEQVRVSKKPGQLPPNERFVGLEHIAAEEGRLLGFSVTSSVSSSTFQFGRGDVLYGRLRPYLRKAAIASFDGYASGEVIVLRCAPDILPNYLLTLLLSDDFTRFLTARTRGDRPRASFETIASYRLELPSLEAQQDVGDRDALLGDSLSRLREASEEVDRICELVLDEERSRLLWSKPTQMVSLSDLVQSIDYGTTRKSTPDGLGDPVLRIPNIGASGQIDSSDLKFAELDERDSERHRVIAGDVLMVRSNGSLHLVGRSALVGPDHENFAFAGYLLRLRPSAVVSGRYLFQLTRSPEFLRLVEAASRSSTGINNLSAGRLARFVVPLVDIETQTRVVEQLERLQEEVLRASNNANQTWLCAREVHERARAVWLGQRISTASPGQVASKSSKRSDTEPIAVGGQRVSKNVEDLIVELVGVSPGHQNAFQSIFDDLHVDYDTARDAVFKLLAQDRAGLVQVFDPEDRAIVLRLAK